MPILLLMGPKQRWTVRLVRAQRRAARQRPCLGTGMRGPGTQRAARPDKGCNAGLLAALCLCRCLAAARPSGSDGGCTWRRAPLPRPLTGGLGQRRRQPGVQLRRVMRSLGHMLVLEMHPMTGGLAGAEAWEWRQW